MFDAALSCEAVFGSMTPLMRTFVTRFVIEQKELVQDKFVELLEGLDVDNLSKLDRPKYASEILPFFEAQASVSRS